MSLKNALQLDRVSKSFDGFKALSDASFTARWGEVHALLGENGAGKSSLMNIAAGLYAPEAGALFIDDNPVRLTGPRDAMRQGIGMVHQHFKLVSPFTVAQNILLSMNQSALRGFYDHKLAKVSQAISQKSEELGFGIDPRTRTDRLSVAEQQRVEILKVLLAGAKILILDEPTAVLTDDESNRLLTTVKALATRGAAVILVTHKMHDVMRYADQVTIMRGGKTVATLAPQSVDLSKLVKLTVGDTDSARSVSEPHIRGAARLVITDLSSAQTTTQASNGVLRGVNLTLHSGEIYGIAGVGGNGQTELANALMGFGAPTCGDMLLDGQTQLQSLTPTERRAQGIAAIPADRYGAALAAPLSVADNYAMGQIHSGRYGSFGWLNSRKIAADTTKAIEAFDVQGVRSIHQKAALLSGGNAQKLVIAREFNHPPAIVFAHSPSRGLDVRAMGAIHARLHAARAAGAAVLLISEDLDEVLALADRIGVMSSGRIVVEFNQPADRQAIGQAMVHHV